MQHEIIRLSNRLSNKVVSSEYLRTIGGFILKFALVESEQLKLVMQGIGVSHQSV